MLSIFQNKKGQISFEIMISVAVLLLFIVVIIIHNSSLEEQSRIIEISYKEKNSCLKVMFATSQVFADGAGTQILFESDYDFRVLSNEQLINVGEQYCYFIARTNNYELQKGEIRIYNEGGVVLFEQISVS